MEGEPEIIKGMVFPYDEKITAKQIRESLVELSKENLIEWYQVYDNYYIQFPNFSIYQKLRSDREYKSDYPPPPSQEPHCNDIDRDCTTCPDLSCHVGQKMREEKGSEEKEKGSELEITPHSEIQKLYNELCPSFPKCRELSEGRKEKIRTRWKEIKTLEKFKEIFAQMEVSNFLKGVNDRNWKASFDWVIENDKNWVKVLEGNYTDNSNGSQNKKVIR
jgi:hypothetical protein